MLTNGGNVNTEVSVLIDYTSNLIENNKSKKDALNSTLANICKNVGNLDNANISKELFSKLNTIKTPLDMISYNLDKLTESQGLLKQIQSDLSTKSPEEIAPKIQNYNNLWNNSINNIFGNYVSVENFLNKNKLNDTETGAETVAVSDTITIHNPVSNSNPNPNQQTIPDVVIQTPVTTNVQETTTDNIIEEIVNAREEKLTNIASTTSASTFTATTSKDTQGNRHSRNNFRKKKHKKKK